MIETKSKTKLVKLLGSIVLGLAFLCLGFFAGFGGKIEEFVKGAGEPTTGGTTNNYENAMIYVDSGASTNITGGSVGAMESGNSVYVADGGTLNVTGGTVSGNIYNGGTLNYTAGTLNSVTLASGKYITFKGNPSSTISITLYGGASVGETVGYLDGITSVTLSRLSVTNLPSNTELRIEGGYIKIRYVNRTVTITASPSGYGSVSGSSITIPHGSSVSVSGSTLSYGSTSITATPATQTAQYTYSFDGWYVGNTQITSSRTITANTTITARFTRTTRTYTVTFTKTVSAPSTFAPSSLLVQEDPGISVYYIVMRALQRGPTATWGGDGLTSNQSSYTVSGSQDFYVNYTIPETTTVEGTGTTIGYTESHSVKIVKNGTTVVNKSSTTTLQIGTYDFTTTGTTTIEIELKTWQSGASIITFDDNLNGKYKNNPIYIDKRQYVILQKRILY